MEPSSWLTAVEMLPPGRPKVSPIPPASTPAGDQCMKIHTLENATPDTHFPVSHTCFFSMELSLIHI